MQTATLLVASVLTVAITSTTAHAQVGAVVVYGRAKPHERQVVAAAVARTVTRASWTVERTAFTQKETDDIVTCLALDRPWPCVAPIASARRVERVMAVQVDPEGKSVVVVGQLLLNSAAVPTIERRFCDPCSDQSLDGFAQEMTSVLLERTISRAGTTAIEFHTVPPGASITIDGTETGTSDVTIPVSPGPHRVHIQRSGYRPHSQQVMVAEGQTFKLATTLIASEPVVTRRDGITSRVVPIVVGGVGAVALFGGAAYSLTRDPPESLEQPRYLYSGAGIAVAAVGGAAVGVALYLWFREPRSGSSPIVSVVDRGGIVGWSASY